MTPIVLDAVLLSSDPGDHENVVATLAFGYERTYSTGLRTPIPDRVLLDKRVFELGETEDDGSGRVAYYYEVDR